MSLSTATLSRLPTIKTGLRKGLNREQIGAKCDVTEKTIDRDMKAWVESGLFEIWIKEEFVDLHGYARDNDPIEAYKQMAKIVAKMVTHKIESKTTVKEERKISVDINATLREYEAIIRKVVDDTVPSNRTRKPLDTTQTNP